MRTFQPQHHNHMAMKNRSLEFASRILGRRSAAPEAEKQSPSGHDLATTKDTNEEAHKQESANETGKDKEPEPFVRISIQQRIDEKRKAKGLPPLVRKPPDLSSELEEGLFVVNFIMCSSC